MTPLARFVGHGAVLRIDDVDTDQIIPAEFCKRLTKSGFGDALFARWRADPAFVLNRVENATASILLAGANFGTGSSREHAVWALRDGGFRAVFASSFGDIFRRNALKNGLLAVQLENTALERLRQLVERTPFAEIAIDLEDQTIVTDGFSTPFAIDGRARWLLMSGLDEIAVTLGRAAQIARYEQTRRTWLPSFAPSHQAPGDRRAAS